MTLSSGGSRSIQLSYGRRACERTVKKWGERRDSNPQQPEPQSGALPLSYAHHTSLHIPAVTGLFRPCGPNPTGLPGGIRTPDPRLRRPLLYPTELQAADRCGLLSSAASGCPSKSWSGRPDLNWGPPAPKAGALPGCATPRPIWQSTERLPRVSTRRSPARAPTRTAPDPSRAGDGSAGDVLAAVDVEHRAGQPLGAGRRERHQAAGRRPASWSGGRRGSCARALSTIARCPGSCAAPACR